MRASLIDSIATVANRREEAVLPFLQLIFQKIIFYFPKENHTATPASFFPYEKRRKERDQKSADLGLVFVFKKLSFNITAKVITHLGPIMSESACVHLRPVTWTNMTSKLLMSIERAPRQHGTITVLFKKYEKCVVYQESSHLFFCFLMFWCLQD